jgi:hypothetical protein
MSALGRPMLALSLAAVVASCGEDDVCQRAINKWNACSDQAGGPTDPIPKIGWAGECADGVVFHTSSGEVTVGLETWSKAYVDCPADPEKCLCDKVPFLIPELYSPGG